MLLEERPEPGLVGAELLVDLLAVLEEDEVRDGRDLEVHRDLLVLVDVDLVEHDVGEVGLHSLEARPDELARPARSSRRVASYHCS